MLTDKAKKHVQHSHQTSTRDNQFIVIEGGHRHIIYISYVIHYLLLNTFQNI